MYFEIYESSGKFYWRLKAANHEIVANGQGYKDKASALHAVELVKAGTNAATPVKELPAAP
jgi:uncharacterized protein YegP (UPF0339 family)